MNSDECLAMCLVFVLMIPAFFFLQAWGVVPVWSLFGPYGVSVSFCVASALRPA